MSNSITVILTLSNVPNSARVPLEVAVNDSPASLRAKASEATKIPLETIRLIFRGRLVGNENDKSAAEEYKLEQDSVIHCMGKPIQTAAVPAPSTATATSGSTVTVPVTTGVPVGSTSASHATLTAALTALRTSNSSSAYLTAVQTLEKILSNIANNPLEEKFRKVKRGNAAFNKRLGGIPGGEAAMLAVGFSLETINGEAFFVMHPRPEAWPMLVQHVAELTSASQSATNAVSSGPPMGTPPAVGMPGMPGMDGFAGMPGMNGVGGVPAMTPQMQQAAAQMMRDPQQLQAMLQNPMVQNMLRNDPRFANNPLMQQSLEQIADNPQMLAQVSQMMQNPHLMNGTGGMGAPQQPNFQGGTANNNARTDQDMTEEEMLEEAIRRSLNDN